MKKILIISPHYPPSNLAAVHRSRLFAQHLPVFGWEPVILMVDEKYYEEQLDWNLVQLLPKNQRIEKVKAFFREAKGYLAEATHDNTNLKYEATKGLFSKKQKLFIHCNIVKEMLLAVDFVKEFGFDVVIVGGVDSWQIGDILKQNNIAVI